MSTTPVRSMPRVDLLTVENAMHAGIVRVPARADLRTVARTLATHQIHCVVVDEPWRVVSDLDVIRGLCGGDGSVTAGDLATADMTTIELEGTLDGAAQLMAEHAVTHLLVVHRGSPVGIVSALDIARAAGSGERYGARVLSRWS